VKCLVCSFPTACDLTASTQNRAAAWPMLSFPKDDPDRTAKIATTAYFDGTNFARRIRISGHYGWGLNDETCPPNTTFAAYSLMPAPKQLTLIKELGHPRVPAPTKAEHEWLLNHRGMMK
jgi:cephalosporin-C deacetylase-like acetyl esterase